MSIYEDKASKLLEKYNLKSKKLSGVGDSYSLDTFNERTALAKLLGKESVSDAELMEDRQLSVKTQSELAQDPNSVNLYSQSDRVKYAQEQGLIEPEIDYSDSGWGDKGSKLNLLGGIAKTTGEVATNIVEGGLLSSESIASIIPTAVDVGSDVLDKGTDALSQENLADTFKENLAETQANPVSETIRGVIDTAQTGFKSFYKETDFAPEMRTNLKEADGVLAKIGAVGKTVVENPDLALEMIAVEAPEIVFGTKAVVLQALGQLDDNQKENELNRILNEGKSDYGLESQMYSNTAVLADYAGEYIISSMLKKIGGKSASEEFGKLRTKVKENPNDVKAQEALKTFTENNLKGMSISDIVKGGLGEAVASGLSTGLNLKAQQLDEFDITDDDTQLDIATASAVGGVVGAGLSAGGVTAQAGIDTKENIVKGVDVTRSAIDAGKKKAGEAKDAIKSKLNPFTASKQADETINDIPEDENTDEVTKQTKSTLNELNTRINNAIRENIVKGTAKSKQSLNEALNASKEYYDNLDIKSSGEAVKKAVNAFKAKVEGFSKKSIDELKEKSVERVKKVNTPKSLSRVKEIQELDLAVKAMDGSKEAIDKIRSKIVEVSENVDVREAGGQVSSYVEKVKTRLDDYVNTFAPREVRAESPVNVPDEVPSDNKPATAKSVVLTAEDAKEVLRGSVDLDEIENAVNILNAEVDNPSSVVSLDDVQEAVKLNPVANRLVKKNKLIKQLEALQKRDGTTETHNNIIAQSTSGFKSINDYETELKDAYKKGDSDALDKTVTQLTKWLAGRSSKVRNDGKPFTGKLKELMDAETSVILGLKDFGQELRLRLNNNPQKPNKAPESTKQANLDDTPTEVNKPQEYAQEEAKKIDLDDIPTETKEVTGTSSREPELQAKKEDSETLDKTTKEVSLDDLTPEVEKVSSKVKDTKINKEAKDTSLNKPVDVVKELTQTTKAVKAKRKPTKKIAKGKTKVFKRNKFSGNAINVLDTLGVPYKETKSAYEVNIEELRNSILKESNFLDYVSDNTEYEDVINSLTDFNEDEAVELSINSLNSILNVAGSDKNFSGESIPTNPLPLLTDQDGNLLPAVRRKAGVSALKVVSEFIDSDPFYTAGVMSSRIGLLAYKSLGLKVDGKLPVEYEGQLKSSLGVLGMRMLHEAEIIKLERAGDSKAVGNLNSVSGINANTLIFTVNDKEFWNARQIAEKFRPDMSLELDGEKTKSFLNVNFEKPKEGRKLTLNANGISQELDEEFSSLLLEAENEAYKVDGNMMAFVKSLDEDSLREFGEIESTDGLYLDKLVASVESANRPKEVAIRALLEFDNEYGDSEFYFNYSLGSNLRKTIIGGSMNPMSSKFQRFIIKPKGAFTTVPKGTSIDKLATFVTTGFGLDEKSEVKEHASLFKSLYREVFNNKELMNALNDLGSNPKAIVEFLKGKDALNSHGLNSLISLRQVIGGLEDKALGNRKLTNVKTTVDIEFSGVIEQDALTSGFAIGLATRSKELTPYMAQVGFYSTDKKVNPTKANSVLDARSKGVLDAYETIGVQLIERVDELRNDSKYKAKVEALEYFLGVNFKYEKVGDVIKIDSSIRKLAKNPFMTFNYMISEYGMSKTISREVSDGINLKVNTLLKLKAEGRNKEAKESFYEFDNHYMSLMGYSAKPYINSEFNKYPYDTILDVTQEIIGNSIFASSLASYGMLRETNEAINTALNHQQAMYRILIDLETRRVRKDSGFITKSQHKAIRERFSMFAPKIKLPNLMDKYQKPFRLEASDQEIVTASTTMFDGKESYVNFYGHGEGSLGVAPAVLLTQATDSLLIHKKSIKDVFRVHDAIISGFNGAGLGNAGIEYNKSIGKLLLTNSGSMDIINANGAIKRTYDIAQGKEVNDNFNFEKYLNQYDLKDPINRRIIANGWGNVSSKSFPDSERELIYELLLDNPSNLLPIITSSFDKVIENSKKELEVKAKIAESGWTINNMPRPTVSSDGNTDIRLNKHLKQLPSNEQLDKYSSAGNKDREAIEKAFSEAFQGISAKERLLSIYSGLRVDGREDYQLDAFMQSTLNTAFQNEFIEDALISVVDSNKTIGGIKGNKIVVMRDVLTPYKSLRTPQEVLAHEVTHAVIQDAIENDSDFRRDLINLYKQVRDSKHVDYTAFMNKDSLGNVLYSSSDAQGEVLEAKAMYNYIFNSKRKDLTHLHEFGAHVVTHKNFRDAVNKLNAKTLLNTQGDIIKGNTIGHKIVNYILKYVRSVVSNFTPNYKKNKPVAKEVQKLIHALATQDVKQTNSFLYKLGRILNKPFAKISDSEIGFIRKVVTAINSSALAPLKKTILDLLRRIEVTGALTKRKVAREAPDVHDMGVALVEKDGLLGSVAQTVKGFSQDDDFFKKLQALSKKVTYTVDQRSTELEIAYTEQLQNDLGVIPDEDQATHRALTLSLLASGIAESRTGVEEVINLLNNKELLSNRIEEAEELVRQSYDRENVANHVVLTAKSLASINITGVPTAHGTPASPKAVAKVPKYLNLDVSMATVDAVSRLVTLESLSLISDADIFALNQYVNVDREQKINGMRKVVSRYRDLQQSIFNFGFKDNALNYRSGYYSENTDSDALFEMTTSKERVTELEALGYKLVDPETANTNGVFVLTKERTLSSKLVSGIVGLRDLKARGVTDNNHTDYDRFVRKQLETGVVESSKHIPIPIYKKDGSDFDKFNLIMRESTKHSALNKDYNIFTAISGIASKSVRFRNQSFLDKQIAEFIIEDMKDNYKKDPSDFIKVTNDSLAPDPFGYNEMFRMTSKAFKDALRAKLGAEEGVTSFYIRKGSGRLLFGFKEPSIANAPVLSSLPPNALKTVQDIEEIYQQMITFLKGGLVTKNPAALIANNLSNMFLLMVNGVKPTDILKGYRTAYKDFRLYRETRRQLLLLKSSMSAELYNNSSKVKRLTGELVKNSVHELVSSGVFSSIIEDVELPSGKLSPIERKTKLLTDKLPSVIMDSKAVGGAKVIGSELFLLRGTAIFEGMNHLTQMSDFMARYVLNNHLKSVTNLDDLNRMDEVTRTFINYDLPDHRSLYYANKMGLILFSKFTAGIQRVVFDTAKKKPVMTGSFIGTQTMLGDVEDINDSFVLDKDLLRMVNINPTDNIETAITPWLFKWFEEVFKLVK